MIPHDKALHVIAGTVLFAVGTLIYGPLTGIAAATVGGILKEVRDVISRKGDPEYLDIVYTVAGGLLGAACVLATAHPLKVFV
jgi:hypothetical protein